MHINIVFCTLQVCRADSDSMVFHLELANSGPVLDSSRRPRRGMILSTYDRIHGGLNGAQHTRYVLVYMFLVKLFSMMKNMSFTPRSPIFIFVYIIYQPLSAFSPLKVPLNCSQRNTSEAEDIPNKSRFGLSEEDCLWIWVVFEAGFMVVL